MIGDYTASWLPAAMLPFICLVCLAASMVLFFYYVEGEA